MTFFQNLKKYPLILIGLLQLLLLLYVFKAFILHPTEIIFCDFGDGMKNLFTLDAYCRQPLGNAGLYHLEAFNYPWGEYVNTTDNTPGFSIPFRWFCLYVYDISAYSIPVLQGLIITTFIISGMLCYKVFERLLGIQWLAFVAAIVLPWTNFQTIRLSRGHFNLSLAFLILWALYLFLRWIDTNKNSRKILIAFWMIVLNCIGFMLHGYYIAIIGAFTAALLSFYCLYQIKSGTWKKPILTAISVTAVSVVLCALFLKYSDPFLSLRPDVAGGYDWMEQKVRFWALWTSPNYYSFPFWIKNCLGSSDPENSGFLGNIAAYGVSFLLLFFIISKPHRQLLITIQKNYFTNPVLATVFLAGLLLLHINFGELYYTENWERGLLIYNIVNPFFWLHKITDQVEQFRSLGRFSWPFFWTFNLWFFYTIYHFTMQISFRFKVGLTVLLAFFGASEFYDYIDYNRAKTARVNVLSAKELAAVKIPALRYDNFQAALILPYYNVGSINKDQTIDDHEAVSIFSYQFYLKTKLPMLNVKLARTIPGQVQQLRDWFKDLKPSPELNSMLSDKPILVIRNQKLLRDTGWHNSILHDNRGFFYNSLSLPERSSMKMIDSVGDWAYYEWYPKREIDLRAQIDSLQSIPPSR